MTEAVLTVHNAKKEEPDVDELMAAAESDMILWKEGQKAKEVITEKTSSVTQMRKSIKKCEVLLLPLLHQI